MTVDRRFSVEELDRLFPPLAGSHRVFLEDVPQRVGRRPPTGPTGSSEGFPHVTRARPSRPYGFDIEPGRSPSGPSPAEEGRRKFAWSDVPVSDFQEEKALAGAPSEDLRHEAANPVPPHLRPSVFFDRAASSSSSRRGNAPTVARAVCASCSNVVLNLRMSGPCPSCLRPICTDCLREALRSKGRGWCGDCLSNAEIAG